MKQIIKTAGAIMEQLRILTGWKFVGGRYPHGCQPGKQGRRKDPGRIDD